MQIIEVCSNKRNGLAWKYKIFTIPNPVNREIFSSKNFQLKYSASIISPRFLRGGCSG